MRIAYYTTDEVNRHIVRQWGRRSGIRIVHPTGKHLSADSAGPIILDLDFLPVDVRNEWLRRTRAGTVTGPVLVHGHNIADADADALQRLGAHVCRGRVRRMALDGWLEAVAGQSEPLSSSGTGS
jgi:hypothetical protein